MSLVNGVSKGLTPRLLVMSKFIHKVEPILRLLIVHIPFEKYNPTSGQDIMKAILSLSTSLQNTLFLKGE